jgi:2-polyprenyl-6-methoxyphenol hydroxylase-like FAD-dependent oxidoreductase
MVADRWREGNVFLAGDAAHLWVPMGGFGMNAGIADAISLGWRLAAALEGWGGEQLLDSYQRERAPIGAAIAGQAVKWALDTGRLMARGAGRIEALERDGAEGDAGRRADRLGRPRRRAGSGFSPRARGRDPSGRSGGRPPP